MAEFNKIPLSRMSATNFLRDRDHQLISKETSTGLGANNDVSRTLANEKYRLTVLILLPASEDLFYLFEPQLLGIGHIDNPGVSASSKNPAAWPLVAVLF